MAGPFDDERRAQLHRAVERGDRAKELLDLVDRLETAIAEFDEAPAKPPIAHLPERTCEVCGGPIAPRPRRGGLAQKYCSPTCRNTANTRARPPGRRGRRKQAQNGPAEPAPEPAGATSGQLSRGPDRRSASEGLDLSEAAHQ